MAKKKVCKECGDEIGEDGICTGCGWSADSEESESETEVESDEDTEDEDEEGEEE
jgi:hypothetical protein